MPQPATISAPAFLTTSPANVYTPPAAPIMTKITQIHIANVTAVQARATLYRGATGGSAAGTEVCKGKAVPANDFIDLPFYPALVMKSTDFLSGLADTSSALVITVIGTYDVVP